MITQKDLTHLITFSKSLGYKPPRQKLTLEIWAKGKATHSPKKLPPGYFAVYLFEHAGKCLKVGKVSGTKNNDRYYQHHYLIKGANSTLARSLTNDSVYSAKLKGASPREWICKNTARYNIHIPNEFGANFTHFVEAYFILKLNPRFEGRQNKLSSV